MISICIGIYNYDVTELVNDLVKQANEEKIAYEIILLDDASERYFQLINAKLDFFPNVTYLQNFINVGRAVIRNTLASKAKYPYLLFLDCDAQISHPDYLKKYFAEIPTTIVSGGTEYSSEKPAKNCRLRWTYGIKREHKSAKLRMINPNFSFTPFNFMIRADIFNETAFDESVKGYGHEDTLFGIELLRKGITVRHIDNPLIHLGLNTTDQYLLQIENAIQNLIIIQQKIADSQQFIDSVALLKTYHKLRKIGLVSLYKKFYKIFKSLIIKNIKSSHPSILFFDLYKLGYLCQLNPKL